MADYIISNGNDFDLTQVEAGEVALVNDLSIIEGTPTYTLTVDGTEAEGMYTLAAGATGFEGTITVKNSCGADLGTLKVGEKVYIGKNDYTLTLTDDMLTVAINAPTVTQANGDVLLEGAMPKARYMYGCVNTSIAMMLGYYDLYGYRGKDLSDLIEGDVELNTRGSGNDIITMNDFESNLDASDDMFFATPAGTWSSRYRAKHVGSIGDWSGTGELVSAAGKGRIQDLFFGSADPGTLYLTDSANGDALFLDDVYTGLPEEIEENTARLFRLRKIIAGAGDDIVDMTSQRFEYTGGALVVSGGDGDDVIWANRGSRNSLFGDAGNDRIVGASGDDVIVGGSGNDSMHGGGGDDIFTFCENWGTDTVEQLETGMVTLWFASGSLDNWNAETLTYSDGKNSVTVSGVSADSITLKFEYGGSRLFATLNNMGAFSETTSKKIFEDTNKGILASV